MTGVSVLRRLLTEATCTAPGCDRPPHGKGLCSAHYRRLQRGVDLTDPIGKRPVRRRPGKPVRERLLARVVVEPNGCWRWTGALNPGGYGRITVEGRTRPAHRIAYELLIGPIPEGLSIDHLCRTPACVNPEHMEPVPIRENILRGNNPPATNARKTHCKNGHPFAGENLVLRPDGHRECQTCAKAYRAIWLAARRDAA